MKGGKFHKNYAVSILHVAYMESMLILKVFSHLGFKSLAHCLMPNPINISVVDELISHKQIVHETLEKFTNLGNINLLTVTHRKNFRPRMFGKLPRKNPQGENLFERE